MPRVKPLDIVLALLIAGAFLSFFSLVPSPGPYLYDEADYITAGSRGLAANFLERPSMSIVEFLKTGLERRKLAQRTSLSEIVRGSHDVTFYRHYHGPIYYYWLAALGPMFHFDEYAMRFSGYFFHVTTFFAISFGVLLLTGSRVAAFVAGSLSLFGQENIGTAAQITPHIPYVFFTVLTLLLFAGYLETGSRRLWYASILAFALAYCSIDYAILLVITFAACLVFFRDRRPDWRTLLRSLLLFAGVLAILWPIGLFEVSAIKGYFYIAYLAMQRKGSYGYVGPLEVWITRIMNSPVEYGIDFLALLITAYGWRSEAFRRYRAVLLPCIIYAGLMLLTTLKNTSLNPTYMSSVLPPLAIVSGIAVAVIMRKLSTPARAAIAAAVIVATAVGGYPLVLHAQQRPAVFRESNIFAALHEAGLEHATLVVPYDILPTISYYFPDMHLRPYLDSDDTAAVLEKLHDSGAQGFLYRIRPGDDLPRKVIETYRVDPRPVDFYDGATLYRIEGHV